MLKFDQLGTIARAALMGLAIAKKEKKLNIKFVQQNVMDFRCFKAKMHVET